MRDDLTTVAAASLPLPIEAAEYSDPVLTLSGDGWSMSIACPWRLRSGGELLAALGSKDAAMVVASLSGHDVEEVSIVGAAGDPVLQISGNLQLEVFADTDLDPWVVRLPSHTVVGTASNPAR